MIKPTDDVTDFEMAEAMVKFGGSFAQHLGRAWHFADEHNRKLLVSTFWEMADHYRDLARLKREQVKG